VPNRTQGRAADLSNPLRNRVRRSKYLVGLLAQKKVVVAKMRAGHVPMKIFGFDVHSEHVGQYDGQCVAISALARVARPDESSIVASGRFVISRAFIVSISGRFK
jgi:hypothetical protein